LSEPAVMLKSITFDFLCCSRCGHKWMAVKAHPPRVS
jgi:hypothetical protein